MKNLFLILTILLFHSTFARAQKECVQIAAANPFRDELYRYELMRKNHLKPEAELKNFYPAHTLWVTDRDGAGNGTRGRIRVLSDNDHQSIAVLSNANHWGLDLKPEDYLQPVKGSPYFEGEVRGLHHQMEYRLLVNGRQLLDPTATVFTTGKFLNSVYWDFDRPGAYRQWRAPVDLRGKFPVIAELVLAELVRSWQGGPRTRAETYRFIAESGVIGKLKEMGYNAVELIPFNTSVDGDRWDYRYQVYGMYGPDLRDGTPDDFAMMIDAFHAEGIAVIMDAVIGHYPRTGNIGPRSLSEIGLQQWKKADGRALYGDNNSPWNTNRYDYANGYIRQFLTDGVLNHFKRYQIDGIRVDNLDGIRFEGGGDTFLREFAGAIRKYRPDALLIGEMFFGENRVLKRLDHYEGMGFDRRTHSDMFDFFKDNWLKFTEQIDMNQLRSAVRNPWQWGEMMRLQYPTNHDEAANRRDGATGAYPATLLKGGGWDYVVKKTKAWGALAMLSGTAYMDLPQMRILQEGNYWNNPQMQWDLLQSETQHSTMKFFASLSRLVQEKPHFLAENLHPDIENHTDYDNKVISLSRINFLTGKRIYAVISLNHAPLYDYRFGVEGWGDNYRVLFDSEFPFAPQSLSKQAFSESHGKPHSLVVGHLRPYEVMVVEEQ